VEPTTNSSGVSGVTAIELSVGSGIITVRVTAGLTIPDKDAMILVVPAAIPLASPEAMIFATLVSELAHVAWEVMSEVVPLE
jgi:hypothetical protein